MSTKHFKRLVMENISYLGPICKKVDFKGITHLQNKLFLPFHFRLPKIKATFSALYNDKILCSLCDCGIEKEIKRKNS